VAVLFLTFSLSVLYNPLETGRLTGEITRGLALIPLLIYLLYVFIQQQDVREYEGGEDETSLSPLKEWAKLSVSLLLILVGVEALVRSAISLGNLLGTPSFVWGLTVIAIVTSLPDTFVSLRLARRGEGVVSLSNVLGSNIFDLLVAVPAGVLIAGATPVDFGVAAPLMGMLTIATVVLFAAMRTSLHLDRWEAWLLLGIYGVFLLWVVLETLGITGLT
jgi:cation:H+ antiporter